MNIIKVILLLPLVISAFVLGIFILFLVSLTVLNYMEHKVEARENNKKIKEKIRKIK